MAGGRRRRPDGAPRRDRGPGRRVRLGQVGHRLLAAGADRSARRSRRRRSEVQGQRPAQALRRADAPVARQPHRHDLPGPADDAQPGAAHWRADDGSHPDARGRAARRGHGTLPRGAGHGRHPLARKAPEELSARVLGRHAPARGDRHRHAQQARPDHLRRADHGAGRHHPGPDPVPHAGDLPRAQHGADLDHPRPGRG